MYDRKQLQQQQFRCLTLACQGVQLLWSSEQQRRQQDNSCKGVQFLGVFKLFVRISGQTISCAAPRTTAAAATNSNSTINSTFTPAAPPSTFDQLHDNSLISGRLTGQCTFQSIDHATHHAYHVGCIPHRLVIPWTATPPPAIESLCVRSEFLRGGQGR